MICVRHTGTAAVQQYTVVHTAVQSSTSKQNSVACIFYFLFPKRRQCVHISQDEDLPVFNFLKF